MPYKSNFLKKVIFRLDFPDIHSLLDESQNILKSDTVQDYTKFEKNIIIEQTFNIGNETDKPQIKRIPQWQYFHKNGLFKFTIQNSFFSIETTKYEHYEPFKDEVNRVLSIINNLFSLELILRIGFRYINNINLKEGNPFEWKTLINQSLLCNIDFVENKDDISRIINQIHLRFDDYKLLFSFGLFNSEFPSKISRKEFL